MKLQSTLLAALLLAGCSDPERNEAEKTIATLTRDYGTCMVANPGQASVDGVSAYRWTETPPAPGSARTSGPALLIHCASTGPLQDEVTLILPHLAGDQVIPEGRYTVVDPSLAGGTADNLPRVAWAVVRQTTSSPTTYNGLTGEVVIQEVRDRIVAGTYMLSLQRTAGPGDSPMASAVGGAFAARPAPAAR